MDLLARRDFLKFMGAGSAASLLACAGSAEGAADFTPMAPTNKDGVNLVEGLHYQLLIAYGDRINKAGDSFGFDNDFIACLPGNGKDEVILWVNHESISPFLMHGNREVKRPAELMRMERESVGGSILSLRKEDGRYLVNFDHPLNRRLHADTSIPFAGGGPIMGSDFAVGTLANCAGGVTPWGHILTAEENYHNFFGEVTFPNGERDYKPVSTFGWQLEEMRPPEHYGWVVEVNPLTGEAVKLVPLGRFAHECATCVGSKEEPVVVYSGDDSADECLYKFIAHKPGSLTEGDLYVAQLETGKWLLLDNEKSPALKGHFKDRNDMLVRTREAAHLVGGTPLARPEDIEVHPSTGDVYVCLTNNVAKGDYHGTILKITETAGNHKSLTFKHETFLAGGEEKGFSSPDNMVFDRKGNLWFTCDVSGSAMHKEPYTVYGNNGLYYVAMSGPLAGLPRRIASAPIDAEFTGPCFSPDGRELFLSVQHPGVKFRNGKFSSNWPDGADNKPRSGVITINGPLLDALVG